MDVRPYGDRALLVDLPDLAAVHALDADLRRHPLAGAVDVVPAARSVVVTFDAPGDARRAAADLAARRYRSRSTARARHPVELRVAYDGPDLADVAGRTGLTPAEVVALHTGAEYVVHFLGFAPGFAYLGGLHPRLRLPRRATPRTRVPAGSVAVAEDLTAVYPSTSPGGWHLLGRTDALMFDPDAPDRPSLLRAGDRVRFVAVDALPGPAVDRRARPGPDGAR